MECVFLLPHGSAAAGGRIRCRPPSQCHAPSSDCMACCDPEATGSRRPGSHRTLELPPIPNIPYHPGLARAFCGSSLSSRKLCRRGSPPKELSDLVQCPAPLEGLGGLQGQHSAHSLCVPGNSAEAPRRRGVLGLARSGDGSGCTLQRMRRSGEARMQQAASACARPLGGSYQVPRPAAAAAGLICSRPAACEFAAGARRVAAVLGVPGGSPAAIRSGCAALVQETRYSGLPQLAEIHEASPRPAPATGIGYQVLPSLVPLKPGLLISLIWFHHARVLSG